jgi:hypothetical protein
MRVSRLKELKANLRQQQTCFAKIEKGNVASVTASYELSRMIAMDGKSYSEGDFVKPCKNGSNCVSRESTLIQGYLINQEHCC